MIKKSLCLFIVVCILSVLIQPMAVAVEDTILNPLSAVERVSKLAEKIGEQRKASGTTNLIAGLLLGLIFIVDIEAKTGKFYEAGFFSGIIIPSILLFATCDYLYRGITTLGTLSPIEKHSYFLKNYDANSHLREKYAFDLLKTDSHAIRSNKNPYSFYNRGLSLLPKLGPNIDTGLIIRNLEEYNMQTSSGETYNH